MGCVDIKKLLVLVTLSSILTLSAVACGNGDSEIDYDNVATAVVLTQTAGAEEPVSPPTAEATATPEPMPTEATATPESPTAKATATSEPSPAPAAHFYPEMYGLDWGYVDAQGTWAIEPQFQMAGDFAEDLAPAALGGGVWGYINPSGEMVIEPRFDYAMSFSEGLAFIQEGDRSGYIDRTGQIVLETSYIYAGSFSEGLAKVNMDNLWGYIDRTGQMVIEPQFVSVGDFSEGLANIYVNNLWGYIDQTGQMVIEPQFDFADSFSEGLALVQIEGTTGYIDQTGQMVLTPQFEWAQNFHEGLAWFQSQGPPYVYGYMDTTGQVVIEPQFKQAGDFSGGLARVQKGDVIAYIDTTGHVVFEITPFTFSESIGLTPEQVSFTYETLADSVQGDVIPAVPLQQDVPPWASAPAHLQFAFKFDAPAEAEARGEPRLHIYPAHNYRAIPNRLRTLLTERPQTFKGEIPTLPIRNAVQIFQSNVAYLDFQGGAGVRFITQYSQAPVPITSGDIYYLFQGLTDDGQYYIAFDYSVTTTALPATFDESIAADDDYETFAENYDPYLQETVQMLNGLAASDYAPDLARLDAMLQSLQISSTP